MPIWLHERTGTIDASAPVVCVKLREALVAAGWKVVEKTNPSRATTCELSAQRRESARGFYNAVMRVSIDASGTQNNLYVAAGIGVLEAAWLPLSVGSVEAYSLIVQGRFEFGFVIAAVIAWAAGYWGRFVPERDEFVRQLETVLGTRLS